MALVPAAYFRPDFTLQRGTLASLVAEGNLTATQERLNGYLETVEYRLLGLLKERSASFFQALTDLQALRDAVTDANTRALGLTRAVDRIKTEGALTPLRIVAAARRRARLQLTVAILRSMQEVAHALAAVGSLISSGDLMGALELLSRARSVVHDALPGVTQAAALRRQADDFQRLIGNTLVTRFASAAVTLLVVGPTAPSSGSGGGGSGGGLAGEDGMSPMPIASFDAFIAGAVVPPTAAVEDETDALVSALLAASGGSGGTAASAATAAAVDAALQADVAPFVHGVVRTGRLGDALEALQTAFTREVRHLVKAEVAEAVAAAEAAAGVTAAAPTPAADGGAAPASNDVSPDRLRALAPDDFLRVLTSLTRALLGVLHRIHALHELVERVLDVYREWPPAAAPADAAPWAVEVGRLRALSSGALAGAVDTAQRHVTKLMSLRREQSARYKVRELRALWEVATSFSAATGALLAHAGGGLGPEDGGSATGSGGSSGGGGGSFSWGDTASEATAVAAAAAAAASAVASAAVVHDECLAHARAMLQYTHTRNMAMLTALLEAEVWKQAEVPPQVQAVADAITASVSALPGKSSMLAAVSAADGLAPPVAVAEEEAGAGGGGSSTGGVTGDAPGGKVLLVKGVPYHVVSTGVMVVKMLGDYSSLAEAVPDMAGEVVASTVELLRTFNARSLQLVLGAGAMQSAHLKRITAKHLALAAQTLGAVLALLPAIRGALIMRLPLAQHGLLHELVKVTHDYMAHEERILAKFASIVRDLLVKCCHDMAAIHWGETGAPLAVPTPPMREFVKGVTTLHRILAPVLRGDQLSDVVNRLAGAVATTVPPQYATLMNDLFEAPPATRTYPFSPDAARAQLGADVRVLYDAMAGLLVAHAGESVAAAASAGAGVPPPAPLAPLTAWLARTFPAAPAPAAPAAETTAPSTPAPASPLAAAAAAPIAAPATPPVPADAAAADAAAGEEAVAADAAAPSPA